MRRAGDEDARRHAEVSYMAAGGARRDAGVDSLRR
jgi:hypothetical protein